MNEQVGFIQHQLVCQMCCYIYLRLFGLNCCCLLSCFLKIQVKNLIIVPAPVAPFDKSFLQAVAKKIISWPSLYLPVPKYRYSLKRVKLCELHARGVDTEILPISDFSNNRKILHALRKTTTGKNVISLKAKTKLHLVKSCSLNHINPKSLFLGNYDSMPHAAFIILCLWQLA